MPRGSARSRRRSWVKKHEGREKDNPKQHPENPPPHLSVRPGRSWTDHLPFTVVRGVIRLPVVLSRQPEEQEQAPRHHSEPDRQGNATPRGAGDEKPHYKSAQVDSHEELEDERHPWMRIPEPAKAYPDHRLGIIGVGPWARPEREAGRVGACRPRGFHLHGARISCSFPVEP